MDNTKQVIAQFKKDLKIVGRNPSTRLSGGLFGVSHETFYRWERGASIPDIATLLESKKLIVAAYNATDKLIQAVTNDESADLVVAERVE